jgi:aconitate hydratase
MSYVTDEITRIQGFYHRLPQKVDAARKQLSRPLTLSEKILFGHSSDDISTRQGIRPERGRTTLKLHPDRIAMQDSTAQMAVLQFIATGRQTSAVPTTIHCDHLIRAKTGAKADLAIAEIGNREVYEFLASASASYGFGFWRPGSGIIHQVLLENYAFPGGLMIGTDSHTPNAGGLGMLGIGVGGADAVDVMVGMPWPLRYPQLIGVHLIGKLSGWVTAKDVISTLAGILTVKGATNHIIEYFGSGTSSIGCTGKATICNMGAEIGATSSVFPFDSRMADFLCATGREEIAELAEIGAIHLAADPEVVLDPAKYYDEIIQIDLSALRPQIVGPHRPDLNRDISALAPEIKRHNYPAALSAALIGSCTNSSYEDMARAADVARQARLKGLKVQVPFFVSPGSERVRTTMERDGLLSDLESIGATVLASACGPCIGQWDRADKIKANSILTSYNRNFPGRNDSNSETHAFIASPEIVTAYALAGKLDTDPIDDGISLADGTIFRLTPPARAELPSNGFTQGWYGYVPPASTRDARPVRIDPSSERLKPFELFSPEDRISGYKNLPVLLKVVGRCTTDQISPAGSWLKFRGNLDRLSDNMFLGAQNAYSATTGWGFNVLNGNEQRLSQIARHYKEHRIGWVVVAATNYGEGSSREQAAISPRYLGCRVVLAASFARIHETNLKRQGVLPLQFADSQHYERIVKDDRLTFIGVNKLRPDEPVQVNVRHSTNKIETFHTFHSLTAEEIGWFNAGSALSLFAANTSC